MFFKYIPKHSHNFSLMPNDTKNLKEQENNQTVYTSIDLNQKYMQTKYNTLINSDIIMREFSLTSRNKQYKSFIIYIDGMVDSQLINRFVLNPLMLRNINNTYDGDIEKEMSSQLLKDKITVKKVKTVTLVDYIYNCLMPQNTLKKQTEFKEILSSINSGNCILFVDTIDTAFDIDVKGFKQRGVEPPNNEIVIKGPQEAFVENIRTNTSLLRRIINNENLIIESLSVGEMSNTKCAICYMQNIANSYLVAEVKYRLNNLSIDTLISTGQLEQLIEDNSYIGIPQLISTERPDKCSKYLMQGRVVILVNGNPYSLIAPSVFIDFLASPEDINLKGLFANFLKLIRLMALVITLLLPGTYIAVTSFHQEILPTELLFSILAARENVPFPIIFEIIIMELSFELIREAGLRVPSPIGATLGIVGALILGDAAVNASIVSPILIIIVAITGLSSFTIPDFSFGFHLRIYRFLFILLGFGFGFLGIGIGVFAYLSMICGMKSFGVPFMSPIAPDTENGQNGYFIPPIWKRENRPSYISAKQKKSQKKISKAWEKN